MIEARYDYAGPFKSLTRAEEVLDNMFNQGDVCEGERPKIVSRLAKVGILHSKYVTRWYITLPM